MNFSWVFDPFYQAYFWQGFVNTMALVVLSGTLGFALAVVTALAQVNGPKPLAWFARGYTTVIRGTPLLVQLFFFYDGIGRLLPMIDGIRQSVFWPILSDAFFYGVVAFTVSVGAYAGEVIRGAMESVPKRELEAARAFGMSSWKVLWRIWLPRAIQICLPTLTGEVILLLKSVPLVSTIAVVDLLRAANIVRSETFLVYEPLLLVAGIYVALTIILTSALHTVERNFPGAKPEKAQLFGRL